MDNLNVLFGATSEVWVALCTEDLRKWTHSALLDALRRPDIQDRFQGSGLRVPLSWMPLLDKAANELKLQHTWSKHSSELLPMWRIITEDSYDHW